jgi:hypothetical protein
MLNSDVIADAILAISLSLTAIQFARWILNAKPRAIINVGRLSAIGLFVLAPAVLLWLAMSGRSTLALILAAFILPVFVRTALRWCTLFSSPRSPRDNFPRWEHNLGALIVPNRVGTDSVNHDLVRQSVAVLRSYVEQAAGQAGCKHTEMDFADRMPNGNCNGTGRRRMSAEEALNVLGLGATAGRYQIGEAHDSLHQKLKRELGDAHYLTVMIDDARDVLLRGE